VGWLRVSCIWLRSVVTSIVYNFRTATAVSTLLPPTNVVVPNTAGVVFQQRDLPLTWTFPVANDTKVDKLKDYVVQVLDYATSTVKGTYTVAPNTDRGGDFLLTFAENAAIFGTAQRQFRVRIFSRDLVGDLSNYVEVVPNNSVPATQSFTVFSGVSSVYLRVTTTPDVDVTGYRVWRDTTSGFTPSDANLVYDGADTYIALSVPTTSIYYYKVAAYDSFGKTGLNISGEQSSTPLTIAPDTFTKIGIELSIGATNRLDWTSGTIIRNGSTSYTISAGNVTWSTGTVYLYFNPSVSIAVLQTSTNLADAVASGCYPIATYTGGAATNIKGGDGSAFISGSQIIAGTVGASSLVAGSAVITGTAQIENGILVNAHIVDGTIEAAKIKDANITNVKIADAAITNAKIDRASVNKLVVTNADIDRASVNKLQVVTADIVDANVSTLKIAGNAVTVPLSSFTATAYNYPNNIGDSYEIQSLYIPSYPETMIWTVTAGFTYYLRQAPYYFAQTNGTLYSELGTHFQGTATADYNNTGGSYFFSCLVGIPANTPITLRLKSLLYGAYVGGTSYASNRSITAIACRR
jgi:hypothetical protein